MTERGIAFTEPLVTAIIRYIKTNTCRLRGLDTLNGKPDDWALVCDDDDVFTFQHGPSDPPEYLSLACPYGVPGDRLWVKETWGVPKTRTEDVPFRHPEVANCYVNYKEPSYIDGSNHGVGALVHRWRSPRFMPRWASRIDLTVLSVVPKRVHDLTIAESIAEACPALPGVQYRESTFPEYELFAKYFDNLNRKRFGWDHNPWVWSIGFRRRDA